MKLYYYGLPGSYSHMAAQQAQKGLSKQIDKLVPEQNLSIIREKVGKGNVAVVPVENSYAGSVHTNLYNFMRYDYKIAGEIILNIDHNLFATHKDISLIKKVYSHPQALAQCHDFLQVHNITSEPYADTAAAVQFVAEKGDKTIAAIGSGLAGQMYGLQTIQKSIQDQDGNRTRFVILTTFKSKVSYKHKANKISILFEAKDIPASLYKCLGGFATNRLNLSKIESLPALKGPFTYYFWIDIKGDLQSQEMQNAISELEFFTTNIKILGQY